MGKLFPQAYYCLVIGIILLTMCGCTHISFHGKGLIPIYLTPRPEHTKYTEISGSKEFYLWGLIGPDSEVFLDEEFYNNGLASVAGISIHEYQKTSSFWKAILSLGFYIPKDYVISGHGINPGGER